jgi:membrane protease YdiL (CAAX protease family)
MKKFNKALVLSMTFSGLILFTLLIVFRGIGRFDFWWWFASNILVLVTLTLLFDKEHLSVIRDDLKNNILKKIFIGFLSAAVLYLVFYIGQVFSQKIFPFAETGIADVYMFKKSASVLKITLLLLFVTSPGEELFWRGFLQRSYGQRYGKTAGLLIVTACYTLVHVGSGNPMLVLAAFLCGLYWGLLYMWKKSVVINITSHALWALAVFVVFPFTTV